MPVVDVGTGRTYLHGLHTGFGYTCAWFSMIDQVSNHNFILEQLTEEDPGKAF